LQIRKFEGFEGWSIEKAGCRVKGRESWKVEKIGKVGGLVQEVGRKAVLIEDRTLINPVFEYLYTCEGDHRVDLQRPCDFRAF
jgi:hypothetical protein